ncbi:hypothetical protein, partial [Zoogloea oleivorans]|uniref:hypothetical protein n=1 Tax=Zoogloea oleivorans TaxID=1552750 RepID=UPI001CA33B8D
ENEETPTSTPLSGLRDHLSGCRGFILGEIIGIATKQKSRTSYPILCAPISSNSINRGCIDAIHASRPTDKGIRAPARAPDAHLLSINLLRTDSGDVQNVREIVVTPYDQRFAGTLTVRQSSSPIIRIRETWSMVYPTNPER